RGVRFRSPIVSILTLSSAVVVCVFLGQAGTTVRGAYDILVSMTVITTLIPFLLLFASMIKLQREPAGPHVIRVPGGRRMAILVGVVGFLTTMGSIVLSVFPAESEPHKGLAMA